MTCDRCAFVGTDLSQSTHDNICQVKRTHAKTVGKWHVICVWCTVEFKKCVSHLNTRQTLDSFPAAWKFTCLEPTGPTVVPSTWYSCTANAWKAHRLCCTNVEQQLRVFVTPVCGKVFTRR